jgi:glucose/arabinose dehydrogenase
MWYGFPDYAAGIPVTDPRFRVPGKPPVQPLLARRPAPLARPTAIFPPHSSGHGLDFSRSSRFGHKGDAFVAQFGDVTPVTGVVSEPRGYKVVRVRPGGQVIDFATNNAARPGPASKVGGGGLERPMDVGFDRSGAVMYVVDFGVVTTPLIPNPRKRTGVLWRITREK